MITIKQRIENTAKLTLERRKEILQEYFKDREDGCRHLTEIERDALVRHLRDMGYYPPFFDMAFRILVSSQRVKA